MDDWLKERKLDRKALMVLQQNAAAYDAYQVTLEWGPSCESGR
jgi:hypothetical protein